MLDNEYALKDDMTNWSMFLDIGKCVIIDSAATQTFKRLSYEVCTPTSVVNHGKCLITPNLNQDVLTTLAEKISSLTLSWLNKFNIQAYLFVPKCMTYIVILRPQV